MDVLSELLCGYLQRRVQGGVTIKAAILLLCTSRAAAEEHEQQQCHCTAAISPCIHKWSLRSCSSAQILLPPSRIAGRVPELVDRRKEAVTREVLQRRIPQFPRSHHPRTRPSRESS